MTPFEITQSTRAVVDGWVLDVAVAEPDVHEGSLGGEAPCLGELLVGHVDADHLPVGPGRERGEEAVGARAAAEVEHRLTRLDRGEIEEIPDAGERVDRRGRDPVKLGGRVAEPFGERPARLEVEVVLGLQRDFLVHALDALL